MIRITVLFWMFAAAYAQTKPSLRELQRALEASSTLPASDVRRFEALVSLVETCTVEVECGNTSWKQYSDDALALRLKIQPVNEHLAQLLMRLGKNLEIKDGLVCYQQAFDIRQKTSPNSEMAAASLAAVARSQSLLGNRPLARTTIDSALRMRESTPGETLIELLKDSASLYAREGDQSKAHGEYDRAIEIAGRLWKPSQSQYITLLQNIASSTGAMPYYAESMHKRILTIQKEAHSERSTHYIDALSSYALFLRRNKRLDDAEKTYKDGLALSEKLGDQSRAVTALLNLAWLNESVNREMDAILHSEAALRLLQQSKTSRENDRISNAQSLLIELYARTGQAAKSDSLLNEFSQYARINDQPQLIRLSLKLGDLYEKQGDFQRAATNIETAVATMDAVGTYAAFEVSNHLMRLARVYQALGRHQEAGAVSQRAMKLTFQGMAEEMRGSSAAAAGFVIFFLGFAMVVCGGCLVASYVFSRRLDHRLNVLYHGHTQPLATQGVQFLGNGATLFSIRIRNLLFSLLTAGVYSFWGKAIARRYVCGQAEFGSDRFVFHGNGKELLFGWLKGLPFIAFIIIFPNVVPLVWQTPLSIFFAQLAAVAAMLVLWPIARAGAYRYRLNRMSWRGIHFSFRGNTSSFLKLWLGGALISALTLGLYYPSFQVNARRYLLSNSWFGDRSFEFRGRGSDLLPTFIFALPLSLATFGLFWAWFSALRHRYYWTHTTLGGARFRCTVTGPRLLKFWLGNAALLIFTLGLGFSWVTTRTLDFWAQHIELIGDPDLPAVRQDVQAVTAVGEGFADFLGFDLGF